jgi:hypothetical protein
MYPFLLLALTVEITGQLVLIAPRQLGIILTILFVSTVGHAVVWWYILIITAGSCMSRIVMMTIMVQIQTPRFFQSLLLVRELVVEYLKSQDNSNSFSHLNQNASIL